MIPLEGNFDYLTGRIIENLEMAEVICRAHDMPPSERAEELRRRAQRLDSLANQLEAAAELEGMPGA